MTDSADYSLNALIRDLPDASTRSRKGLESLGLERIHDLLHHYPRRHEDRRQFDRWPTGPSEQAICVHGEVTDAMMRRFGNRRGAGYFEVRLEPPEAIALAGPIYLRWFNSPWMKSMIAVGQEIVVYGSTKITGKKLTMAHPDFEVLEEGSDADVHMNRIVPVYPAAAGLNQRLLRTWIHDALARVQPGDLENIIPNAAIQHIDPSLQIPDRVEALRALHFPRDWEAMDRARTYLALEEFCGVQIEVLRRKRAQEAQPGLPHAGPGYLMEDFLEGLPFELTGAQKRCIAEVRRDLESSSPMNRLLQGDVGAGKTLVAFAAILLTVEAGFQAALMAPTQILAEQHYLNFRSLAEKLDLRIALRTGSRQEDSYAGGLFGGDTPQVIIGTHALIHDRVDFENLGLAIIDEQHKFGVSQRSALTSQGVNPDLLVMTATPIPRTLTMTVYGDLDVSILDELPKDRGKIITRVRSMDKTEAAADFVRDQLEEGRQAYVVYPLVEESSKQKSQSAKKEAEAWTKRLSDYEVGLLHGKIPPDEKEALMSGFRSQKVDVLVATTVIEVGVDVPNANIMLIFNAEKYGLAQLHQLRGRIGRGKHKSWCVLMHSPDAEEEMLQRLHILEQTRDGFLIAEEDLKIRGPGDVLGTRQSGLPDLRFASLLTDTRLVQKSRDLAALILDNDPDLARPEHQALKILSESRREESERLA